MRNENPLTLLLRNAVLDIVENNSLVIVEGTKDKRALERLGITHILTLRRGTFQTIDHLTDTSVIILTDFDAEGKQLYSQLKKLCEHKGIRVDDTLRKLLFKTELSHVEGITRALVGFE